MANVPNNRRATVTTENVPYIEQKMQEWGTDYSQTINTIILEHRRAGVDINNAQTPATSPVQPDTYPDTTDQLSSLTSLLDFGMTPS
ncbi:MAG: hypothetical protein AAGC93_16405 [Cyanobacteria bacterium P01_F01_bin.53]